MCGKSLAVEVRDLNEGSIVKLLHPVGFLVVKILELYEMYIIYATKDMPLP